jgi:hypothetical protein
MEHEGLKKMRAGDFNYQGFEWQGDGSVVITLTSRHYPEVYRLRVRDLYGPNEEVIDEEVVEP